VAAVLTGGEVAVTTVDRPAMHDVGGRRRARFSVEAPAGRLPCRAAIAIFQ